MKKIKQHQKARTLKASQNKKGETQQVACQWQEITMSWNQQGRTMKQLGEKKKKAT